MKNSKWLCIDRAIQYHTFTVNPEHSLYETSFENAAEPILIEQRGRMCMTGMSAIIPTQTKFVDNESKAVYNM